MLRVIDTLNAVQPLELVPTYLVAHALQAEYADLADEYLRYRRGQLGVAGSAASASLPAACWK